MYSGQTLWSLSAILYIDLYQLFIPLAYHIIILAQQAYAEADTFFCFVELLSGFRDNFCKQLDNSVVGIRSTISKLSQLLKRHDEELWRHLEVTTKVRFFTVKMLGVF